MRRCASEHENHALRAAAVDVADYVDGRHAVGASPATVRSVCAAVAKLHQVSLMADPSADGLCPDIPHPIGCDVRARRWARVSL